MKVAVIGDGIVGFAAAQLLTRAFVGWEITVFGDSTDDAGKSLVINRGVADVLTSLSALPANTRPISRAQVSFADAPMSGNLTDDSGFYCAIDRTAVITALRGNIPHTAAHITDIRPHDDSDNRITLTDSTGQQSETNLLLITCPLPHLPPPFTTHRYDYHQTILSFTARHGDNGDGNDDDNTDTAHQKFFAHGIAVLVPRTDNTVGIILCLNPAHANHYSTMTDTQLAATLSTLFAIPLTLTGNRYAYSPALSRTTPIAADSIACIGQGATTLHPVGAQALRLAFGDIIALRDSLKQTTDTRTALHHYARRRLTAHRQAAATTTALSLPAYCNPLPVRWAGGLLSALLTRPPFKNKLLSHLKKLA